MIYLYRVYQILIALPLCIIFTIVASVVTAIGCIPTKGRFWGYYPAKIWAMLFAWVNLVSVRVKGRENIDPKTSYVFVANHQSAFDIFTIYGFLRHNFKWMMKASLRKVPFVGYACYKAGHIFVERGNAVVVRESMDKARRQLADGMSVVVFPEGSRSLTGRMGVFKRGAYTLATELNLPVVPLTIDGAYRVMPRTAKLPRPGRITLTIHKPITPPDQGYDIKTLIDQSRDAIASALPDSLR